jgi:hypothetical protein
MQMPTFFQLPSGTRINVASINGVVPGSDGSVTLHFEKGGTLVLAPEDATALQERLGGGTGLSSNVKTAMFWFVILAAVGLVVMAVKPH